MDTTTGAECWWYEGAGLYRDVCLELVPRIRINECDTVVETTSLGTNQARLNVTIGIENQSFANQRDLCVRGSIAGHTEEQAVPEVAAFSTAVCAYTHEVAQPKLWSVETPHLYTARFQLLLNGKVIDEFQQTFGIRTVGYHADGFYLNGRRTELRGVCEHQDFGGVGVAINRDILRYKLLKMKAMGVNAYRSAHHFASPDLLQLCDQLGLMVMNENRVLESSGWRVEELERMVKQTRHHPCQCFWSLCNEEVIGNTPFANRVAKKLAAVIRNSTSQSLIVSAELLNPEGVVDEGYLSNFDVCGVNYPESGVNGAGLSVLKARHPDQRFLSTESASYFSTRGIYKDDAPKCQASNFGSRFSMVLPGERQPDEPGAGGTAHPEEVMGFLQQHPFTGGVFLWTFMDYCGEPAPFPWPGISFQFGITDTAGLEKDYFYYYQSKWQQEPMIHVMPHWNEEGLVFDDNEEIEVRVFSNCSEVELFINDVSCGLKTAGKDYTTWRVPFEAGVLKAIGYKGEHSVEDARITSDPLTSLAISQRYAGEVYDLFEVTGVDQAGVYTPMAEALVSVSVSGGAIVGLANGNPADISEFSLKEKKLFSGKLIVIVKKRAGFSPVISAKIK